MADPNLALHGVTLAHHAAVIAALAEGHALDDVLRVERIAPADWAAAHGAWSARLTTEAELALQHREALEQAEDALARRVEPIDYDLAAWLGFFRAWSFDPAPAETLARLGLKASDVARLQRLWARRASQNAALGARLNELAVQALPPPPALSIGPAELRASRFALAGPNQPAPGALSPADALDLDEYATIRAELAVFPEESDAILEARGVEKRPDWDAGWRARLEREPATNQDFRSLYSHFHGRLTARRKAGLKRPAIAPRPAMATAPAKVSVEEMRGTVSVDERAVRAPALPFGAAAEAAVKASPAGAKPTFRRTAEAADGPFAPSLPFVRPKSTEPEPSADPPSPEPETLVRDPRAADDASGAVPVTPELVEVPNRPALPFEPGTSPPTLVAAKAPDAKEDKRVMRATKPSAGNAPAATGIGDAELTLSLEQHASLTVELALAPDQEAATLARYRVTAAVRARSDAAWQARRAADAAVDDAWKRAYETYRAWLVGKRSPP